MQNSSPDQNAEQQAIVINEQQGQTSEEGAIKNNQNSDATHQGRGEDQEKHSGFDQSAIIAQSHSVSDEVASNPIAIVSPPYEIKKEIKDAHINEIPYSSFTTTEKKLIILAASLGSFLSPLTTNIYFPALSTLADDLNVTISKINLTITTYMVSPHLYFSA